MEKIAAAKIADSEGDWRGERMDRYRRWGKEREPIIEEWAHFGFGFTPESRMAYAASNRLHTASIDGWRVDDEGLHLAEHKTSNVPLDEEKCAEKGYDVQVQWQMHVTDAVDTMVFWEERLNDPSSETGFAPGARGTVLIARDDAMIAVLVGYAEEFLSILQERAFGDDGSTDDPMLDDIVTRLETAKATVKELDPKVRQMMTGIGSAKTPHWVVSYESGAAKEVPDPDRFAAEHPEEAAELERIALVKATAFETAFPEEAVALARITALRAAYTRLETPNPTLRITKRKDV